MDELIPRPLLLRPVERIVAGTFAGGIGVGGVLVAVLDPSRASIFPACPLLSLTGIACPGCGLTRGFHALFHGDVVTALDFNALIPLYAVLIVFLFFSLTLTAIRGRGLSADRIPTWSIYGIIFLSLAFAVLRNLPWEPFRVLYP